MRILWIATKSPYPPIDGGRLLMLHTLQALAAMGHQIWLVAPFDPAVADRGQCVAGLLAACRPVLVSSRRRGRLAAAVRSVIERLPVSVALHRAADVRREVERLLDTESIDVVHVEQIQAFAQCAPALERSLPVVLRAQNVESDLWRGMARTRAPVAALWNLEARRLALWEAAAIRRATRTIALSAHDVGRLSELAGGSSIIRVAAPFPAVLPRGTADFDGSPALILLANMSWGPNRDGAVWFLRALWPELSRLLPGAVLHHCGGRRPPPRAERLRWHGPLTRAEHAFPAGDGIAIVPLRVASGVRMRILEAWARGTPVVATPAAAVGLDATPGRELAVGENASELAKAIEIIHGDPERRAAMVDHARERLRAHHDPEAMARQLSAVYADALTASS